MVTATQARPKPDDVKVKPVLTEAKVHLGPGLLIVKSGQDELHAQPGDVIVRVNGKGGVLAEEAYEALGGDYADLVKKTWVANAIARRRDDGLPDLNDDERKEVEEQATKSFESGQAYQKSKKERQVEAQENPIVLATSKNAPPTANPLDQGTVLPNPDLPVLDGSELAGASAVTSLNPSTVALGAPNFDVHVMGGGFTEESVIVFNGHDEPTTFVSHNELTTGVNMSVWQAPAVVPVAVRTGDKTTNSSNFEFTGAAAMSASKTPPAVPPRR